MPSSRLPLALQPGRAQRLWRAPPFSVWNSGSPDLYLARPLSLQSQLKSELKRSLTFLLSLCCEYLEDRVPFEPTRARSRHSVSTFRMYQSAVLHSVLDSSLNQWFRVWSGDSRRSSRSLQGAHKVQMYLYNTICLFNSQSPFECTEEFFRRHMM